MSVFMDLNLSYTADRNALQSMVDTAAHLGFSTVAINYLFEPTAKKKQEIPTPTPINELIDQLPIVQGRSRPIRVLNRLTVVMSDSSHFRPTAPEYRSFDLLAVQPTTEKLFHAACMLYDVDIICISVTEKLPFFFKRAPVNGAVDRGLVFEVSYSAAIRDSTMRRYTIANAVSLMDSCKGKSVILSSAAEKALELRGPYDVTNLGLLFGLSDGDAKEAVTSTCRSVLLHAETRKTASGIIYTMRSCSESSCQQEAPPPSEGEAPAAKRHRPALTE
ncbi:ribonuclease P protein subunit p30 isoform X2 [Seriola lalandi dorsalis]|uniref:ribonuclease P protein subunit p30 isoform X2 n=1 Tax=Seriola lalandi dorsalis TaxID=1841481 RepID=UPI000C6F9518|nr:ribonuclease P protein subunit p30 isoform X2 [Seriola lalandi dorsalis]XP_056222538.1 ribonuclease P protein subunit p30 isoform X2 [Seriola aureovittata]